MKRCVYCGNENDDSAVVCAKCGNPLPDRPDGQEDRETGFAPQQVQPLVNETIPAAAAPEAAAMPAEGTGAPAAAMPAYGTDTPADGTGAPAAAMPAEETGAPAAAMPAEGTGAPADGTGAPAAAMPAYGTDTPADGTGAAADVRAAAGPVGYAEGAPAQGYQPDDSDPVTQPLYDQGAAAESFAGQPEGTTVGRIPPREAGGAGAEDFAVGRGQTYGARQQYQARGGKYASQAREQYGSAGYGYRQAAGEAPQAARTDYARMNTQVGSKTILIRSRKMVKGFLFFMMTLFFTAAVASNLLNMVLPCTMDPSVSNAYYNLTNVDSSLEAVLGSTNGFGIQLLTELAKQVVTMVVNVHGIIQQLGTSVQLCILLIFAVPNVLYALALWIMFGQTKRSRVRFGMGGYTLARVMMVLKFIVGCLVLAVGLIISVYFVVVGASSAQFTSSFIQGLIMLIVMIVLAIFTIMYYIQWIFMLKCAKVNTKGGLDIGRAPTYIGVISILAALGCAAAMIPLSPDDYLGLAAAGSIALYFLFSGLWVLVYRGAVRRPAA